MLIIQRYELNIKLKDLLGIELIGILINAFREGN